MSLLLTIYLVSDQNTVRVLAEILGISKPAVTRAVDALSGLGFLRRAPDPRDKRSVLVQRTVKGLVFLREFAESVTESISAVS
jgi:DNA-binding MarR family transcriptional regulator